MANSTESQGIVVAVGDGGSPSQLSTLNNITDFSGPGGQASVIDVSSLASTRREKKMGLPDEGQFTLTLNWDPDDTVHQALRTYRNNRTRAEFRITLTDGTPAVATFFGYVLGVALSAAVDQVVKAAVTIEIDGGVSWN